MSEQIFFLPQYQEGPCFCQAVNCFDIMDTLDPIIKYYARECLDNIATPAFLLTEPDYPFQWSYSQLRYPVFHLLL